jgi:hypothetical protein
MTCPVISKGGDLPAGVVIDRGCAVIKGVDRGDCSARYVVNGGREVSQRILAGRGLILFDNLGTALTCRANIVRA